MLPTQLSRSVIQRERHAPEKILFNSCQQQAQGTTDKAAPEKPAQQPAVPPSTDTCTQPKGQQLEAAGSSWKQLKAAGSS